MWRGSNTNIPSNSYTTTGTGTLILPACLPVVVFGPPIEIYGSLEREERGGEGRERERIESKEIDCFQSGRTFLFPRRTV